MPHGDHTGPNGQGPKTGRAAGNCAGDNAPGILNPGQGRGLRNGRCGNGRGKGPGMGNGHGNGNGCRHGFGRRGQ
jgi:hypothetical protein